MTPSTIKLKASAEDHHIARLAALAIGLSAVEAVFPSPIPGVKPGIANIVILVVLHRHGLRPAIWVSLLRVVAGSLLFGTFLAPTFVLSLAGAVCSLASLAAARRLPPRYFGPVSHSVCSSFAHIAGQLIVVYLWLIPHSGIVYLIPVFAGAALTFGAVNGLIAARLVKAESAPGQGLLQGA
jgi:heptaprenyl diphosphate synthase